MYFHFMFQSFASRPMVGTLTVFQYTRYSRHLSVPSRSLPHLIECRDGQRREWSTQTLHIPSCRHAHTSRSWFCPVQKIWVMSSQATALVANGHWIAQHALSQAPPTQARGTRGVVDKCIRTPPQKQGFGVPGHAICTCRSEKYSQLCRRDDNSRHYARTKVRKKWGENVSLHLHFFFLFKPVLWCSLGLLVHMPVLIIVLYWVRKKQAISQSSHADCRWEV